MIEKNKILVQLERAQIDYTETDLKIKNFLIKNINFILENSIVNIGKAIGVSDASITRFCKKNGFSGFIELKTLLNQENSKILIEKKILKNNNLNSLTEGYRNLISKSGELINAKIYKQLVTYFTQCKRIRIYGIGHSGLLGQEVSYQFKKIGFDITGITDTYKMKIDASLVSSEDLIIGISLSGENKDIISALHLAKEKKATIVVFTYHLDSKITSIADLVIPVYNKIYLSAAPFISLQVPLIFQFDYLYSEIVSQDPEKYFEIKSKVLNSIYKDE